MSALSDLSTSTGTSTTTLPSWYCAAQQGVVKAGINAFNTAPQLSQTLAQCGINKISNPATNPFSAPQSTLGTIASGAANPFIKCAATGQMTPNTCTAMGQLFAAQRQQLLQCMPWTTAPVESGGIASGNFGSLRGQTAVDTAMGGALNAMLACQSKMALQNQQTGVQAAANQANVGQQCLTNLMNMGQTQMTAPYTNVANAANILGTIKAPETVSTTQTATPINQLGALSNLGCGLSKVFTGSSLACLFKCW